MGINVYPRYYRHPKYFRQQILKFEDIEDRFNMANGRFREDKRQRDKDTGIFVCPECNTTFECFLDTSNAHKAKRYQYLPNEFPRAGLERKVCDECNEAKLTFAAKFGSKGGNAEINKKNIKKIIGKGDLSVKRGHWGIKYSDYGKRSS